MLNELKKIALHIDTLIKKDSYSSNIEPDFLKEAMTTYPYRGGKRIRPALLLWSCGLLDGNLSQADHAACAVEIYHNWTLVHDDIIDNDELRRSQPTTHTALGAYSKKRYKLNDSDAEKFGRDFAILAGDLQQGWAINMLLKSSENGVSDKLTIALSRRLQELVNRELISGEALDVKFPYVNRDELKADDIEKMLYLKTGVLLKFCTEAGAAIALNESDFNHPRIKSIGDFATSAGLAFQLRDDWLGIYGNEEEFGKPICSDLAESKPTLLMIYALKTLNESGKAKLESYIGCDKYSDEMIKETRDLITNSGAGEYILNKSKKHALEAQNILNTFPDNKYKKLLSELVNYLIDRKI